MFSQISIFYFTLLMLVFLLGNSTCSRLYCLGLWFHFALLGWGPSLEGKKNWLPSVLVSNVYGPFQ
jgi:hypothetical protein